MFECSCALVCVGLMVTTAFIKLVTSVLSALHPKQFICSGLVKQCLFRFQGNQSLSSWRSCHHLPFPLVLLLLHVVLVIVDYP